MKICFFTRYGRLGASSRLRFYQYFQCLQDSKFEVEFCPLFSDEYVEGLQRGIRSRESLIKGFALRFLQMIGRKKFDLIVLEKELFPWLPSVFDLSLISGDIPVVIDYDDAVFHLYDQSESALVRRFLGSKHSSLARRANLVIAGNEYLANHAKKFGASWVELLPTAIDLNRYPVSVKSPHSASVSLPVVGWIGQRSTADNLLPLKSVFRQFTDEGKANFAAIGIDTKALDLPMNSIAWSESSEVVDISQFDIGIMPLIDGPFERGKCGYKLIQYMACGLPVIASPVGVNQQIVEHGVNGYLASTLDEWISALEKLTSDIELRRRMGQAGRAKVEREYCIQVTGPRLCDLLRMVALRGGR